MKNLKTNTIVKIALLGAISAILMMFRFPLPFAPGFMDLDIAEVPALVGGFAMGPLAGFLIVVVKILVKIITQGTSTAMIGELSNLIISSAFVVTASVLYKKRKSFKSAIFSLVIGVIVMTAMATLSNYFVIFPLYGIDMAEFAENAMASINPLVNNTFTFILFSIIPFNLVKGSVASVVTVVLYKSLSPILKKEYSKEKVNEKVNEKLSDKNVKVNKEKTI